MASTLPSYSFQLKNATGLASGAYKVQVLGFSVASKLFLQKDTASSLKWGDFPSAFTQSLTTTSASTKVTLDAISAFDRISVGDAVSGANIPTGTTVTEVSVNITLSNPAENTGSGDVDVNVVTMVGGNLTDGSDTITNLAPPPSLSSIRYGQVVEGAGIPAGTTVAKVTRAGEVTLSAAATASGAFTGTSPGKFNQKCTASLTQGSATADISGMSSSDQVVANLSISGTNIPTNTIVQTINSVTLTLSNAATVSGTDELSFSQSQPGTISGTSVTGLTSTANLGVGYPLTGSGIPENTVISEINSTSAITLLTAATSTGQQTLSFPPASGIVPSYDIDTFTSFDFGTATQPDGLNGARIYFFVVPDTWPALGTEGPVMNFPTNPPGFPYAWNGTGFGIEQPNNPPNAPDTTSGFPPFGVVEPTIDAGTKGGMLHIDVQTVDGFTVPLTLSLENGTGTSLGEVGQPLSKGLTRGDIITAFQTQFSAPPYSDLLYGSSNDIDGQYPGILNPGGFLAVPANDNGTSTLRTMWDSTLGTLYTGANVQLNMIGDDGDYYKGVPDTFTSGADSYNVLKFTGYTDAAMTAANGNVFRIFDPTTPDPMAPNYTKSSGYQVFANDGVYNDASTNVIESRATGGVDTPEQVVKGLERDIVCALNRGMALKAPYLTQDAKGAKITRTGGDTSAYWGLETNWYPYAITELTQPQNQFSLFMHTGAVTIAGAAVPIFTQPTNPTNAANGLTMGMAYGFAYDENPVHGAPGQNEVPSKFDPVPTGTSTVTITAGEW